MEATVNGTLVFIDPNVGISAGATLTVTSIDGAATDGTLTVAVVPLSATDLAFGPGSGEFDPPGSGNIISVNQINFVADVSGAHAGAGRIRDLRRRGRAGIDVL